MNNKFSDVSGALAGGSAWMLGMRAVLRLVGLLNVAILARLLTPEDFGVVAMASLVVGFLQLLADVNVDLLLLRQGAVSNRQMNVAWTLQATAGIAISILCLLLAPLMAHYYSEPRVTVALYLVALQPAIIGFENIGVVMFRKELRFDREFAYWVTRHLLRFGFGLGLALALRSYIALAIAVPMSAAITVAVSYWMSSYRPRFEFSNFLQVWKSARWLVSMNVGQFLTFRADEFVIAGFAGASNTGTYYVASDFATMVNRELVGAIGRAVYPTVSRISGNKDEMAVAFNHIFGFHVIACLAIGTGLAIVAPQVVPLVLGEAWTQGIPIFAWVALCSIFEGLIIASVPFLITSHHERFVGLFHILHGVSLFAILFACRGVGELVFMTQIRFGVAALALSLMLWRLRALGIASWWGMADISWRPLAAAALMMIAVMLVNDLKPASWLLLELIINMATGAVSYVASLFGLWLIAGRPRSAEHDIRLGIATLIERIWSQLKQGGR